MAIDLQHLSNNELIELYAEILHVLKERGVIRTKNFIGDLGEFLAIEHYQKTPGLPKLQPAPIGTKNVDAISRNGDRYNIKTTQNNTTGAFYGLPDPTSMKIEDKKFEFVIIVQLSDDLTIKRMVELTWEQFIKYKRWASRIMAWNLSITRALLEEAKIII